MLLGAGKKWREKETGSRNKRVKVLVGINILKWEDLWEMDKMHGDESGTSVSSICVW